MPIHEALHEALRRWDSRLLAELMVWCWLMAACAPVPPPPAPPPAPYFSATDVSMDSPTDGWAVGNWIIPRQPSEGLPPGTPLTASQVTSVTPAMAHYQHGQWRLAPTSVAARLGSYESFDLVRMLSPTDGWAATTSSFVHYGDDLYHYDGAQWRLAYPPAGALTRTINVADLELSSPESGWAVGADGILQYMHGAWVNVTSLLPPPPADWESKWPYPGLRSVSIASPTDVWAMGDGGVIWHYDGARWRMVASPYFPNRFYTSPSVDGYTATDSLLAHFATDAHNLEALYASQMLSPTQGWSVGGVVFAGGSINWGSAVVEQYQNGGAWQVAHVVPRDTRLSRWPVFYCLALTSMQDGWIGGAWAQPTLVGSGDAPPGEGNPTYVPLLLHYHAGQWTFVTASTTGAIHRLVMLSPGDGWAASDGGLLHYTGGQWRLVSVQPAS